MAKKVPPLRARRVGSALPVPSNSTIAEDLRVIRILSGPYDRRFTVRASLAEGFLVVGQPYRVTFPDWRIVGWNLRNRSKSVPMDFWFTSDVSTTKPQARETLDPDATLPEASEPWDFHNLKPAKYMFIEFDTSSSDLEFQYVAGGYGELV